MAMTTYIYGTELDDELVGVDDPETGAIIIDYRWSDTVFGYGGNDTIEGRNGFDSLQGGDGNDIIDGGQWYDYLYGEAGDDVLYGGGAPIDPSAYSRYANMLWGGTGNDRLYGGSADDDLHGEDDEDYLEGGARNDRLYGGDGNDVLLGGDGDDYLSGGKGIDVIDGGAGFNSLLINVSPSDGETTAVFDLRTNLFTGKDARDDSFRNINLYEIQSNTATIVYGSDNAETINFVGGWSSSTAHVYGGLGNDIIYAAGENLIHGGGGDDTLYGELAFGDAGNDHIEFYRPTEAHGGAGRDVLLDAAESTRVFGDGGADYIEQGYGISKLTNGYDQYDGGTGNDFIHLIRNASADGGAGNDTLSLLLGAQYDGKVNYNFRTDRADLEPLFNILHTNFETFAITHYGGAVRFVFGEGNDFLYSRSDRTIAFGGSGNDILMSQLKGDRLHGEDGDDFIYGRLYQSIGEMDGGRGDDYLVFNSSNLWSTEVKGGEGNDTFVFFHHNFQVGNGPAIIEDFEPGVDQFAVWLVHPSPTSDDWQLIWQHEERTLDFTILIDDSKMLSFHYGFYSFTYHRDSGLLQYRYTEATNFGTVDVAVLKDSPNFRPEDLVESFSIHPDALF